MFGEFCSAIDFHFLYPNVLELSIYHIICLDANRAELQQLGYYSLFSEGSNSWVVAQLGMSDS